MAGVNILAVGAALAALLALLAAPVPTGASQLNMYEGPGCSGDWKPCRNDCCPVGNYTGSYRFYYNEGWWLFLYKDSDNCNGSPNGFLTHDVDCTDGFDYKSVLIHQMSSFPKEQLIKLPRAVAAGKK